MKYCSPTNKTAETTRHHTYGTPLRRSRKPSTPTVKSPSPLTFLSPSSNCSTKRKPEFGSPKIGDKRSRLPELGSLETKLDQAKELNKQLRITLDSPSLKFHCPEMKDWLLPENPPVNMMTGKKLESSKENENDHQISKPTSCFPRSVLKRRKLNRLNLRMEPLEGAYRMIDQWQEEMYKLQSQDWEFKRKYWIDQCHNALWSVLKNPTLLEIPGSEMFPKILLPITQLTEVDKHWLNVLVNSARVESIKSPEFAELTHDPQNKIKTTDEEFEFQIKFQFGFDIWDLKWNIQAGRRGLNQYICGEIAEFVGHSKFVCDVQIYYKKSATPWWEQDGIAKMKYYLNGEYVDMIDFSPEAEVYFVQEWPQNNLVVDDYNDLDIQLEVDIPEDTPHMVMERIFISAVCCQIIHICICKTPAPKSCAARNVLKQVSMILKGWFIGVLLGEGLGQIKMAFEYDTRAPSLAPTTTVEGSS